MTLEYFWSYRLDFERGKDYRFADGVEMVPGKAVIR